MALTHLQQLEAESIKIMREVAAEFENPVMLYSIGKDSSVLLHLARKAFYPAKIPFPLLHVDTNWKFKEMIKFRDEKAKELGYHLYKREKSRGVGSVGVSGFVYKNKETKLSSYSVKGMQCYKSLTNLHYERSSPADTNGFELLAVVILPLKQGPYGQHKDWENIHERYYNWLFNDSPWSEIYYTKEWSLDLYKEGILSFSKSFCFCFSSLLSSSRCRLFISSSSLAKLSLSFAA